jgi:large subunit ribosomal protein L21
MYALVKVSGRQYRVAPNRTFQVDRLDGEAGASIVLDQVMLVSDGGKVEIGTPTLPYTITCELLRQGRGPKGETYRCVRRGGHRVKRGWRHHFSVLRVKSIEKGN